MWVLEVSHETTIKIIWDVSLVDLKQTSTSILPECSKSSTESSYELPGDGVRPGMILSRETFWNKYSMPKRQPAWMNFERCTDQTWNSWNNRKLLGRRSRQMDYTGRKQWPSFYSFHCQPESSGSRFIPLGWENSAWASEVHVTRPTMGRNL